MKSALLFNHKLVADLTSIEFTIDPYDPCIANKIIKGTQMTTYWDVDDLLIGHADPSTLSSIITDKKLDFTHSPHHDYLGMTVDL